MTGYIELSRPSKDSSSLPADRLKKCIDLLASGGVRHLVIKGGAGGDALSNPHLLDLYPYAQKKKLTVFVQTELLKVEEGLIRSLAASGMTNVLIDWDESITDENPGEKTLAKIDNLVLLSSVLKKRGSTAILCVPITNRTVYALPEIAMFAHKMGLFSLFSPGESSKGIADPGRFSPVMELLIEYKSKTIKIFNTSKQLREYYDYLAGTLSFTCGRRGSLIGVDEGGQVIICGEKTGMASEMNPPELKKALRSFNCACASPCIYEAFNFRTDIFSLYEGFITYLASYIKRPQRQPDEVEFLRGELNGAAAVRKN